MNDPIVAGVGGLVIQLVLMSRGTVHDASDAISIEIVIQRPNGTRVHKPATVSLTEDGEVCIQCVTDTTDLPVPGKYLFTGYVEDIAGNWPAFPIEERVYPSGR